MNRVTITGRITNDIELKQTPNGISVCTFSVAVKRPNVQNTTDFINCVAWRNTAEFIVRYFKKGVKIEIDGILTSRKYQDQKGNNRIVIEVIAETVDFGESKNKDEQKPFFEENIEQKFENVENDGELPF